MGSVDLLGILLGSYQPNLCSEKRCWSLFSNVLNIVVVATFQIHTNVCIEQVSGLYFRAGFDEDGTRKPWKSESLDGPGGPVSEQIRLDGINQTSVQISQGRCIYCKSNTRLMSSKCDCVQKAAQKKLQWIWHFE